MGRMLSKMNLISVVQQLPKEDIETIQGYVEMIEQECEELNKQLENANEQINYLRRSIERKEERIIDLQDEKIPYTNEYVAKLLNQQKKFIAYLENMLDNENDIFSVVRVKDVLSKYKEIIECKDGNLLLRSKDIENFSDGYHTFNELYEFRKLYNALLFKEWKKKWKV